MSHQPQINRFNCANHSGAPYFSSKAKACHIPLRSDAIITDSYFIEDCMTNQRTRHVSLMRRDTQHATHSIATIIDIVFIDTVPRLLSA